MLALLSLLLGAVLFVSGLPAALLLGPMIAAIAAGLLGAVIRVSDPLTLAAQGIVSMLIASAMKPETLVAFLADWPLFVAVVIATIVASSALGWLMGRRRIVPGTTAIWGSSPGGASAMVLMAEASRRRCAAGGADAIYARRHGGRRRPAGRPPRARPRRRPPPPIVWFPALDAGDFAATIAIAVIGTLAGKLSRIPSGALIVPMVAGAVLQGMGLVEIVLPEWLLSIGYALIGWRIGLGFTRATVRHAAASCRRSRCRSWC